MIRFQNRVALCTQIAHLGGLGKAPWAPGTVATVVAGVPAVFLLGAMGEPLACVLLVILFLVGCYCAELAEAVGGKIDPGEVVIDELVGFLITMFGFSLTWKSLVLGIISFRVMDIWKPWPVGLLHQKLKGGVAIVMDDVAAGILAHVLVWGGLELLR